MGRKEPLSTTTSTTKPSVERTTFSKSPNTISQQIQPKLSSSQILTQLQSSVQKSPVTTESGSSSLELNPTSFEKSLDEIFSSTTNSLWKSAKSLTQQSFSVSLETLSSRTQGLVTPTTLGVNSDGSIISSSGKQVSLEDFQDSTIAVTLGSTALAIAALALLPSNIGATVCYLIAFIPIAWVAIGSTAPFLLANLIAMTQGSGSSFSSTTPVVVVDERKRVYCHEAGHFLCGYLCGLPIQRYSIFEKDSAATSNKSFFDAKQTQGPQVEFFQGSSSQLNSKEIATLSVVALSGSVAEILSCGTAQGGAADLTELDLIFRRRSQEFIGAQKQEELTRWGALTAYQLLTKHKEAYEKLILALEQGKDVLECIAIIEGE